MERYDSTVSTIPLTSSLLRHEMVLDKPTLIITLAQVRNLGFNVVSARQEQSPMVFLRVTEKLVREVFVFTCSHQLKQTLNIAAFIFRH